MRRAKVKRSRRIGGGYGTEWATWIITSPDGMSGVMAFHPTHAEALSRALAEMGLLPDGDPHTGCGRGLCALGHGHRGACRC